MAVDAADVAPSDLEGDGASVVALRPDEFDGIVVGITVGPAWGRAVVVSHLRPVLRREELCRRIGQVV